MLPSSTSRELVQGEGLNILRKSTQIAISRKIKFGSSKINSKKPDKITSETTFGHLKVLFCYCYVQKLTYSNAFVMSLMQGATLPILKRSTPGRL